MFPGWHLFHHHLFTGTSMHIGQDRATLVCARTQDIHNSPHINPEITIELTEIGKIIKTQWHAIPYQFDSVSLDEFIIMPNYVHGIIIIQKRTQTSSAPTLGHVVRAFKSICTMQYLNFVKSNGSYKPVKIWQRSYYDHIIHDEKSLNKIKEYIHNNPLTMER